MRFSGGMIKIKFGLAVAVFMVFLGAMMVTAQAEEAKVDVAKQIEAGKAIFEQVNCLMCHLLNGQGGGLEGAPDFAGVKTRRDQANLREWLGKHLFEEPRIDMFEEDPTKEDIENLVQYLYTL